MFSRTSLHTATQGTRFSIFAQAGKILVGINNRSRVWGSTVMVRAPPSPSLGIKPPSPSPKPASAPVIGPSVAVTSIPQAPSSSTHRPARLSAFGCHFFFLQELFEPVMTPPLHFLLLLPFLCCLHRFFCVHTAPWSGFPVYVIWVHQLPHSTLLGPSAPPSIHSAIGVRTFLHICSHPRTTHTTFFIRLQGFTVIMIIVLKVSAVFGHPRRVLA
mmetsp:Transcript_465/g.584  ORF Transcript_465/g.584 Transcript_465/m.584 type:complete len:215 (-) Transcript_465:125-769(-)